MSVLTTTALTMQFGAHRALDQISVEVPSGVTGLVGANGAGKTTLMSIALGLRPQTSGAISVLGLDPRHDGERLRRLVGYGPERNVLPEDMPAFDFVKHLSEIRGMPRTEARSRASDVLWLVGLGEERFRALGTMSTGQRQRVKLAQAVAADPSLVLLDEPTDGLDPVQRDEMLALIRQISDDFGIDVILSSHLLEEVERVCDNIVALDAGSLIAHGSLDSLVGDTDGLTLDLVELTDRPDAVARVVVLLRERGIDVEVAGDTPSITLRGPDRGILADAARDVVAETGARLRRMAGRRRTLEDLFAGGSS